MDKIGVCNLALAHLAQKGIATIDEPGDAARTCLVYWEKCLATLLKCRPWPFASKIVTLALVASQPNTEWAFAYRYPSDCLQVGRILSGSRADSKATRVPYRLGKDDQGLLLYCDLAEAQAEYTATLDDSAFTHAPHDFCLVLSYLLASKMAPRLTGEDVNNLGKRAEQYFAMTLAEAWASACQEEAPDQETESALFLLRQG
jgi:hypothetical protein